jgi:hypothetical protein
MIKDQSIRRWFMRGFGVTLLLLLVGAAVVNAAEWTAARSAINPNWEEQPYMAPDVVFAGPEVDLDAYVRATLSPESYTAPLIVPAADFNRDSNSSDYYFLFTGGFFGSGLNSGGCFMAPVYLPHGVTINNFFMFLYDNSTTHDISVFLRRKHNQNTSSSEIMAGVSTSGASTNVQTLGDITVDFPVVDPNYSYFITTCMQTGNNDLRIYGSWIYFTP